MRAGCTGLALSQLAGVKKVLKRCGLAEGSGDHAAAGPSCDRGERVIAAHAATCTPSQRRSHCSVTNTNNNSGGAMGASNSGKAASNNSGRGASNAICASDATCATYASDAISTGDSNKPFQRCFAATAW